MTISLFKQTNMLMDIEVSKMKNVEPVRLYLIQKLPSYQYPTRRSLKREEECLGKLTFVDFLTKTIRSLVRLQKTRHVLDKDALAKRLIANA